MSDELINDIQWMKDQAARYTATRDTFISDVAWELRRARSKHSKPFHSAHEGIAIIREEYLEVEQEVFHGEYKSKLREEIVQLAAMCQRMAEDLNL